MRNSFVVCFLAVAFSLVVCFSANAQVSEGDATREVEQAKTSVTTVHNKAKNQLDNAQRLLRKVETSQNKAEDAKVKSQAAAEGNTEAEAIANTIKSLSNAVDKLYATEKQKLDDAVSRLTVLVSEAETLNGKADITIEPDTPSTTDYTRTNGKAAALKLEAAELDGNITAAVTLFTGVESTANTMESNAKKAQLKDSKVSVIVAVAKIKSIFVSADTIILQIEEEKREVSGIVDQMQTLKTNAPTVSGANIEALHTNAANALTAAKDAGDNANSAKADIQKQKDLADEALTKVKAENQEVSDAQKEVDKANACVNQANKFAGILKIALQTAKESVTKAKDAKKEIKKALSRTTTAPNTVQATETEKANHPVEGGTEPDQKDTTIQPTRKELPNPSNNSTDILKDALIKGAQNVATTALTGGKAPAPGAKNDSAMTVSVPLLVALIASAVLQ